MPGSVPHLTAREREIVKLASAALSNKEIASELKIGEQSVKNALSIIFLKCGVRNRVELVTFALRHDLT